MPTDEKPSRNEDEYFVKRDAELLKAQRAQLDELRAKLDEERATQARMQHYMKCPKCGSDLAEREFHHVKVDSCPGCQGMWLDKGELEMIAHVDERERGGFLGSLFGLRR